jgi:hypothetical protein
MKTKHSETNQVSKNTVETTERDTTYSRAPSTAITQPRNRNESVGDVEIKQSRRRSAEKKKHLKKSVRRRSISNSRNAESAIPKNESIPLDAKLSQVFDLVEPSSTKYQNNTTIRSGSNEEFQSRLKNSSKCRNGEAIDEDGLICTFGEKKEVDSGVNNNAGGGKSQWDRSNNRSPETRSLFYRIANRISSSLSKEIYGISNEDSLTTQNLKCSKASAVPVSLSMNCDTPVMDAEEIIRSHKIQKRRKSVSDIPDSLDRSFTDEEHVPIRTVFARIDPKSFARKSWNQSLDSLPVCDTDYKDKNMFSRQSRRKSTGDKRGLTDEEARWKSTTKKNGNNKTQLKQGVTKNSQADPRGNSNISDSANRKNRQRRRSKEKKVESIVLGAETTKNSTVSNTWFETEGNEYQSNNCSESNVADLPGRARRQRHRSIGMSNSKIRDAPRQITGESRIETDLHDNAVKSKQSQSFINLPSSRDVPERENAHRLRRHGRKSLERHKKDLAKVQDPMLLNKSMPDKEYQSHGTKGDGEIKDMSKSIRKSSSKVDASPRSASEKQLAFHHDSGKTLNYELDVEIQFPKVAREPIYTQQRGRSLDDIPEMSRLKSERTLSICREEPHMAGGGKSHNQVKDKSSPSPQNGVREQFQRAARRYSLPSSYSFDILGEPYHDQRQMNNDSDDVDVNDEFTETQLDEDDVRRAIAEVMKDLAVKGRNLFVSNSQPSSLP